MSSNLRTCPEEVISAIVVLLQLDDIRNLRLTCKSLTAKSLHQFKSFFYKKEVDLALPALQSIAERTKSGGLWCLVRDLCLTGIAHEDGGNGQENEEDTARRPELLSQVFQSLAQYGEAGTLSLSLRVAVITSDGKRIKPRDAGMFALKPVWLAAEDTFNTCFRAIAASKLQIESLNIFNGPDSQRCSLASDHLDKVNWADIEISLRSLRALSISLSNRVFKFYERKDFFEADFDEDSDEDSSENSNENSDETSDEDPGSPEPSAEDIAAAAEVNNESNFAGLGKLLSLLKQLDSFELHYVPIRNGLRSPNVYHERLMQSTIESDKLPRIKQCRLRGIRVRYPDLLSFIQNIHVQELSLEAISANAGTLRAIIDHCSGETSNITKLYFDEVYENHGMVHFFERGQWIAVASPLDRSRTMERQGDAVKIPFNYCIPAQRMVGCPEMAEWLRLRRREYGPL